MFDARPEAFGSYRVLDEMRAGRAGRVFRAQEPSTGAFVVVKVVEEGVSPERAPLVAAALARLCSAPLDHPSIVAPFAAGLEGGLAWVAEPQVEGELLVSVMGRAPAAVPDVLVRLTQLAGALDFAAAAGIRHGALHPRSIIISGDRTLIAGLGLQQALAEAGVEAPIHDDLQVLAAIAGEWLAGTAPPRVRAVLEAAVAGAQQGTALEFAAALQNAIRNPQSAVRDPQSASRDPQSGVRDPQSAIRGPQSGVRDPQSAIRDPQFAVRDPEPAIRQPQPDAPVVVDPDLRFAEPEHRFADAPLRVREPRVPDPEPRITDSGSRIAESRLLFADSGPRIAESGPRNAESGSRIPDRSPSMWPPMAAMLAIGLLGGFAGGYLVGQRDATPVPHSAERAVRRSDVPAPTTGRDATEAEVPTEVREPDVRAPAAPVTRNPEQGTRNPEPGTEQGTANANREPGTGNREPAALVVESRPRGARVFLDGRLVGQTPLTLPEVTPGEHAVRIDLVGYRRWVTTITTVAGERTRVAASLER